MSRGERKVLLVAALTTIAIAKGGLVPSEIPALGITVQPEERLSLLYLLTGILVFYLVGFWLYGRADLKRRKAVLSSKASEVGAVAAEVQRIASTPRPNDPDRERNWLAVIGEASAAFGLVTDINRFARWRIGFDVYAPLFIATVALGLVLHETWRYPGGRAIGMALLGVSALLVAILIWSRRKKIWHLLLVKRHRYYLWRTKRLAARTKNLPQGSSRRAALQAKARPLIEKAMKGPWV